MVALDGAITPASARAATMPATPVLYLASSHSIAV